MAKKISLILLVVLMVAAAAGGFYYWHKLSLEKRAEAQKQADETAIRNVVENFGKSLKNVSLLSPTATADIEQNYKKFLSPDLLAEWKDIPAEALGRTVSSPWPDRIEISKIEQFGSGAYNVTGSIIEVTSVAETNGGAEAKSLVGFALVKFGDVWLIAGVVREK
jgi:hypothetical protein